MEFFFIYVFTSFKLVLIITMHYINTANKTAEMGTRPQIVAEKNKKNPVSLSGRMITEEPELYVKEKMYE